MGPRNLESQPDMHHNTSEMSIFSCFRKSSEKLQNHSKMLQNMFLECPGARGNTFEKFLKKSKNHDCHHFWRHLRAFGPHLRQPNCVKIEYGRYQQILCDNLRNVSQRFVEIWPRSRAMLRQR